MNYIFDFDGTIADSFDHVLEFLLAQAGRNAVGLTDIEHQHLRSLSMRELATHVGIPLWNLPLVFLRGKARMANRMARTPLFSGMRQLVIDLYTKDQKLYIVSSNSRRNVMRFLKSQNLDKYFIRVYGNAGWFGKGIILRRIVKRNRLNADKTVYIGDEVRDIVGAKLAGLRVIAVSWGFGHEKQLQEYGPTVLVRTIDELQKALEGMNV